MSGLLAVVPAKGTSRGVIAKNLRLVDGVPMFLSRCRVLAETGGVARVVASTDSPEIAGIARLHGFTVIDRPAHLATDEATVADVAQHVVEVLDWQDDVGVFQPTSPLVSSSTIEHALKSWPDWCDSLMAVTPVDHFCWLANFPLFDERVNRQWRDPHELVHAETGAIQLARNQLVRQGRLVGDNPYPYTIQGAEAIDIDSYADLAAARLAVGRKRIQFRVAVGRDVGSGHLYRCLRLAEELAHHDITFSLLADGQPYVAAPGVDWAWDMVRARGWEAHREPFWPDLVVHDALDSDASAVAQAKANGVKLVTFEDEGDGARYADLVINELAHPDGSNTLAGPRFSILRAEYACLPPYEVRDHLERVLIVLGGTDAANLSGRLSFVVRNLLASHVDVRLVLGPGVPADHEPDVKGVTVLRDVRSMAAELHAADLVLTSMGRTTYECAAVGVPFVALAANERESRHYRLPGGIYLGPWVTVADRDITEAVLRLDGSPSFRGECSSTLRGRGPDGLGLARVCHRIHGLLEGLD